MTHARLSLLLTLLLTACATTTPGRVCTGPLVPINAPALTPAATHQPLP